MRFPLILLSAALLVTFGCNRNEPRSTQAAPEERTNTNATDQMKNERDTYVNSVDACLAEYDQKFDGLDERANAMNGTTKDNFKKSVDALRDQRKAVTDKLDDLKKVNVESWTTMRGEVDSAMAALDRSYMQVSNMYQNTPGTRPVPNSTR